MPSAKKTINIGLNQWISTENPKRQDFVDDNFKIDEAIGTIKADIEAIDIAAEKTTLKDTDNNYTSTNVEGALIEVATSIKKNKTDIATNLANITKNTASIALNSSDIIALQNEVLSSKTVLFEAINRTSNT